jgi:mRNA-degrading endonuclease toxin of MazEF toxin-antitoxin module
VAASGDDGQDAAVPQLPAYGCAVVALVTEQGLGAPARVADPAGDGRDAVHQCDGLGDKVKILERTMFGRASFRLLRIRILTHP